LASPAGSGKNKELNRTTWRLHWIAPHVHWRLRGGVRGWAREEGESPPENAEEVVGSKLRTAGTSVQ
jgi:hypothetical protein